MNATTAVGLNYLPESNLSSMAEDQYLSWLQLHKGHEYGLNQSSKGSTHYLFSEFLQQYNGARILLKELTQKEKAVFNQDNRNAAMTLSAQIRKRHGNGSVYELSSNNATFISSAISSANLPGSFPQSPGEYVMVSMNYYGISWWYPGPWYAPWQGHWGTLDYGEHDIINLLFVGSDAQYWYNHMFNTIGTIQTYDAVGAFLTGGITAAGTYYGIAALTSSLVGAIAGILVLTAFSIYAIQTYMGNQLHAMYDSTYANPQKGNPKLLWEFYDINFYYPWITVVGTYASSFTWNGYTNSGTVSILPYIPVASNNPAFVIVASALSGETHNLANRIGWDSWGQYYGWQW